MKASEIPNLLTAEAKVMFESIDGYVLTEEQLTRAKVRAINKVAVIVIEKMPACPHSRVRPMSHNMGWACDECFTEMEPTGFKVKEK